MAEPYYGMTRTIRSDDVEYWIIQIEKPGVGYWDYREGPAEAWLRKGQCMEYARKLKGLHKVRVLHIIQHAIEI